MGRFNKGMLRVMKVFSKSEFRGLLTKTITFKTWTQQTCQCTECTQLRYNAIQQRIATMLMSLYTHITTR